MNNNLVSSALLYLGFLRKLGLKYKVILFLLLLQLTITVFESFSVTLLLPLFELIASGEQLDYANKESMLWEVTNHIFELLGLDLSFSNLMFLICAAITGRMLFNYVGEICKSAFKYDFIRIIKNRIYYVCLGVSISKYEKMSQGQIENDILIESEKMAAAISAGVELIGLLVMLCIYIMLMSSISPFLTALLIVLALLEGLIFRNILNFTRNESKKFTKANRSFTSHISERLKNIRHIRLGNMESAEINENQEYANKQFRSAFNISTLSGVATFIIESLAAITIILFFYIGIDYIGLGLITMMIFLGMTLRVLVLFQSLISQIQKIYSSSASFEVIQNLVAEFEESKETDTGDLALEKLKSSIKFENVSYQYDESRQSALSNINITIEAASITALVGPVGAGKSTFIDLIPRLRLPDSGNIYFDNILLTKFDLESLRNNISYVSQKSQILDISVIDHIRYDSPDATYDEVINAAELAGADEFIKSLPDSYQTCLGVNNITLSSGQRQRLDLARALLKKATILILDEPSSNLDIDSEQYLCETLNKVRKELDITIIIIAHRYTTIKNVDKIIVLNNGTVEDSGEHLKILDKNKWYKEYYESQFHANYVTSS